MSDFTDGVMTDVARLVTKLERRARRIEKLEAELKTAQDTLATMTEFHWQDEILISDELNIQGRQDMQDYAYRHISKNGAECLGRRMLEDGYLKIGAVKWRDQKYMGTWYRVNVKAIVTKATTSAEREVRKNDG